MNTSTKVLRRAVVASLVALGGCGQGDALAQDRTREEVQEQLGDVPTVVDTTTAASLSRTFRAAAAKALPSVVTIQITAQPRMARGQTPFPFPFGGQTPEGELPPQYGTGSGFVFTEDGHIITNNHVVENATELQVRFVDGRVYDAQVVGRDPNTDVAVIRVEPRRGERFDPLEIGDSDRLQVGDWVIALGNPLSLGFTVTQGIVSAKGRSLGILRNEAGALALESFIQTDAAINRGNSGGPLVDLFGRVVGVNSAIVSPTQTYAGNGFAIPIALAAKVARDLIEFGVVHRPRIGVLILPVTETEAELYGLDRIAGAVVREVQPGSPAAEAGLRPEDVIVELDGARIDDQVDLTTRLARRSPGDRVTLTVVRDGKRMQVPVRLGEFQVERPTREPQPTRRSAEQTLGFTVAALTNQIAREIGAAPGLDGVVVTQVSPYGPAANRLQRGDVILEVNRQRVTTPADVERIARDLERGDIVVLRFRSAASGNPAVISYRIR